MTNKFDYNLFVDYLKHYFGVPVFHIDAPVALIGNVQVTVFRFMIEKRDELMLARDLAEKYQALALYQYDSAAHTVRLGAVDLQLLVDVAARRKDSIYVFDTYHNKPRDQCQQFDD